MNEPVPAALMRPSPEAAQGRRLLVCGDAATAGPWCDALAEEGLAAVPCSAGPCPVEEADAVLLCVAGPLAEQLPRLREIRARAPALPLVVACRTLRDFEQVLALESGADDVVDARVPAPVLAARLRAVWRRAGAAAGGTGGPADVLRFGGLALHAAERQAQLHGQPLALTDAEFELLWLLASRAGQAVPRSQLLRELRGLEYRHLDRSVDCRVWRLRCKLGDGRGAAQRIRTVRNCGYLFSPAGW